MTNSNFESIEEYKDIAAINGYKKTVNESGDVDLYMKNLQFSSRDNGRTPMQWDATQHANFTTGDPWLPVNDNYKEINVAVEENDPNSVLNHFKRMVELRKNNEVLIYGDYTLLKPEHPEIYAYTRELEGKKMLVLLNFKDTDASIELTESKAIGKTLINNFESVEREQNIISLKPYQAVIFSLN